jgi:hypothetical protein
MQRESGECQRCRGKGVRSQFQIVSRKIFLLRNFMLILKPSWRDMQGILPESERQ